MIWPSLRVLFLLLLPWAVAKIFTLDVDGTLLEGAPPPPEPLLRVALVTAIFGSYDDLQPLPFAPNTPADGVDLTAFCFTDDPGLEAVAPPGWRVVLVGAGGTPPWPPPAPAGGSSPAWHSSPVAASNRTKTLMAAKFFKAQGHRVRELRGFAAMFWVDASTRITFAALPRYLGALLSGAPAPAGPRLFPARGSGAPPGKPPPTPAAIWLFPHPERDSPVEEALVCTLAQQRYSMVPLVEHAALFMRAGYPFACAACATGAELWAMTAFFRAFGPREDALFDGWWAEILAWDLLVSAPPPYSPHPPPPPP